MSIERSSIRDAVATVKGYKTKGMQASMVVACKDDPLRQDKHERGVTADKMHVIVALAI